MENEELFDVWEFFPDGTYIKNAADLTAEEAALSAKASTMKPVVKLGMITKVMITDKGDCCVFLWEHDKGIVYPKPGETAPRYKPENCPNCECRHEIERLKLAVQSSLLVLCVARDGQTWHKNFLKDFDFAIAACRGALHQ